MKKPPVILLITIVFSGFCLFFFERSKAQSAQEPKVLFDLVGTERLIAKDEAAQSASLAAVREQEIAVNFDNNFDTAKELDFRLLDGMLYKAVRSESEGFIRFSSDEFTWRGKISGENNWSGDVVLTVKGNAISALIYSPNAVYEIVPQENFRHLLVELDQSQFPACAGAITGSQETDNAEQNTKSLLNADTASDDGSLLDVLVVYTAPVRTALGGTTQTQAFVQQAIASANTAYQNSAINPRLRLVNSMEVSYSETGTLSAALDWVDSDATVAAARNTWKADLVAILVENASDGCGVAYVMRNVGPGFAPNGFSATARGCAVGNLSFAHEIGHNEGCEHNPENGGSPGSASYPYAFGHYVNGSFRTVMSYADPCPAGCNRVAYFSNPAVTYNGLPTGITDQRDNRRVINNTALTISQFRESGGGGSCTTTPITLGQTINGTLTSTDCRYPLGSNWYSDVYTFSATAGQQIAITMTSSGFDTWLALQDPNGTELIFNNDGGGGTNSRIPASSGFYALPSTGTYKIQASSNLQNASGGYSISLTAPGLADYDPILKAPRCGSIGNLCDSGSLLNGRDTITGGPEPNQPNTITTSCADGTSGSYHNDESIDAIKVSTLDGGNFAPGKTVKVEVNVWVWNATGDFLDLYYSSDANNPSWTLFATLQAPGTGNRILNATYQLPSGSSIQAVRAKFRYGGNTSACGTNSGYDDYDDLIFPVTSTKKTRYDFDGDGKAEIGVFRPSNAFWFLINSSGGYKVQQWGGGGDQSAPADYDGDGRTDIAVYRPSTGYWYVSKSSGGYIVQQFGSPGDVPVPADYDGDGRADIGVYRPSTAFWYVIRSTGGYIVQQFGSANDQAVQADYDADGRADIAVYRPSTRYWYVMKSTGGYIVQQFGSAGDKAVAADYDGDGRADIGVYRPSTANWYVIKSTGSYIIQQFGSSGDLPVAADYDGDGRADIGVYRPSTAYWYIMKSTGGYIVQQFGSPGDLALPAK